MAHSITKDNYENPPNEITEIDSNKRNVTTQPKINTLFKASVMSK